MTADGAQPPVLQAARSGKCCPKPDLPCGSEDRLDGVGDKLPMLALDLRAARLHEYSELRTAGEEPSVR
jgi:hypothetical protein